MGFTDNQRPALQALYDIFATTPFLKATVELKDELLVLTGVAEDELPKVRGVVYEPATKMTPPSLRSIEVSTQGGDYAPLIMTRVFAQQVAEHNRILASNKLNGALVKAVYSIFDYGAFTFTIPILTDAESVLLPNVRNTLGLEKAFRLAFGFPGEKEIGAD